MERSKAVLWSFAVALAFSGLIHSTDYEIGGVRGLFSPSVLISVCVVGIALLIPFLVCHLAFYFYQMRGLVLAIITGSFGLGSLLFFLGSTAESAASRIWSLLGSSALVGLVLVVGVVPVIWFTYRRDSRLARG